MNRTSLERTAARPRGSATRDRHLHRSRGVGGLGLPTCRGPGGHYDEDPSLAAITDGSRVEDELDTLWARWGPAPRSPRRSRTQGTVRSPSSRSGDDVTVITMNVDGLHRRALTDLGGHVAPERLVEIHGDLARSRCVRGADGATGSTPTSTPGVRHRAPGGGPYDRRWCCSANNQWPRPNGTPACRAWGHHVRGSRDVGTVSTGTRLAANARFAVPR
ncbi:MAG: hypothetical protein R2713_10540 [Ilumatobacteraceae bacterium]